MAASCRDYERLKVKIEENSRNIGKLCARPLDGCSIFNFQCSFILTMSIYIYQYLSYQ